MVSIRNAQNPGLAGRVHDSSLTANGQSRFMATWMHALRYALTLVAELPVEWTGQ